MTPLERFIRARRRHMVAYAAHLLSRRFGADRAADMAEDVVQETCLFCVETGRNTDKTWNERYFVGSIRFHSMRAGVVAASVIEVRNTAGEDDPRTPKTKRRSRVTNFFPVQVFGTTLDRAYEAAPEKEKA